MDNENPAESSTVRYKNEYFFIKILWINKADPKINVGNTKKYILVTSVTDLKLDKTDPSKLKIKRLHATLNKCFL